MVWEVRIIVEYFCKVNETDFECCFWSFFNKYTIDDVKYELRILFPHLKFLLTFIQPQLLLTWLLFNFRSILNSLIFFLLIFDLIEIFVLFIKSVKHVSAKDQNLSLEFPIVILRKHTELFKQRQNRFNRSFSQISKHWHALCLCNGRSIKQSLCCILKVKLVKLRT